MPVRLPQERASIEIEHSDVILTVDNGDFIFLDCAYEELLQSLGPINDTSSVPWTMFNDNVSMGFFDVYDQYILNILYDPRIKAGMTVAGGQGGAARGACRRAGVGAEGQRSGGVGICVVPPSVTHMQGRLLEAQYDAHRAHHGVIGPRSRRRHLYADFSNSSRPISMRRISLVPAPIS